MSPTSKSISNEHAQTRMSPKSTSNIKYRCRSRRRPPRKNGWYAAKVKFHGKGKISFEFCLRLSVTVSSQGVTMLGTHWLTDGLQPSQSGALRHLVIPPNRTSRSVPKAVAPRKLLHLEIRPCLESCCASKAVAPRKLLNPDSNCIRTSKT